MAKCKVTHRRAGFLNYSESFCVVGRMTPRDVVLLHDRMGKTADSTSTLLRHAYVDEQKKLKHSTCCSCMCTVAVSVSGTS